MKSYSGSLLMVEEFFCVMDQAVETIAFFSSPEMLKSSHGELEQQVAAKGREFCRALIQANLDLRANAERTVAVTDADGMVYGQVRAGCHRDLMTLFGEVVVNRVRYSAHGRTSLFPMDRDLNLPVDKYSHGIRRLVAEEAAKASYDECVKSIAGRTGTPMPKRQAEQLAVRAAKDFDAFYERQPASPDIVAADEILVLSTDMKGIVVRTEDLRPATRRAAERKPKNRLEKRLCAGEKRERKRMATVCAVYRISPHARSAEQVIYGPWAAGVKVADPPHARDKRVFASIAKDPAEVIEEMFREADRRDPGRRLRWVMLIDGDRTQIRRVLACAKKFGVDNMAVVQDFIHVIEYLWKAVTAFHAAGTKEAQTWVSEHAIRILHGEAAHVAAGIRRSATHRGIAGPARKAVDTCANYLLGNKTRLRYDLAMQAGLPIATGVIEGACRHLVKDRMDITGARWSLTGAEAVLFLRSLRSSGDFDEYWAFHLAQEHRRNHLDLYAESVSEPKAA